MSKKFITYLLIVLATSMVSTTYISFCKETCKTSLVLDVEKDCDESLKELEIKFLHPGDETYTYNNKVVQIKLLHKSKAYNSVYQKQENPPPESIT